MNSPLWPMREYRRFALADEDTIIDGNNFHKLVPQDKTQPNVYTYMMHWRDEKEDTNAFMKTHLNDENFKGEIQERFEKFILKVSEITT